MSDKIMSIEELAKMQEKVIDATKSDAPVAIETPTTSVVNGDPSKVQSIDPKNYTVELWLPVTSETPATAERVMGGSAYKQLINADQKFITARIARRVRNYASTITLAFTKFNEDGDSEIYSVDDLLKVYEVFDDDVIDACEKLVGTVLGIPDHLMQYITDTSLIETCTKIIENNPSFFQAG